MSKEFAIQGIKNRHAGEKICYTTCLQNGCWDAACILKVHVKGDKITAIDPDDSINHTYGREDAVVGEEKIKQGLIQMRPCVMGHSWKGDLYAEDRILYPLKRIGARGGGQGRFERISWDEAIDTIAARIGETLAKYPDASILHTHHSFFEISGFPLTPYTGGGIAGWSDQSTSGHTAAEKFFLGYNMVPTAIFGTEDRFPGFEAPDLLNSKLIVLWAWDPLVGWHGAVPYYLKLAREKGIPIIVIDPRYTLSAEVLADQYIPIRPGTDIAMMLAVAQVLYEKELWDKEFVAENVDPDGFAKFRAYVEGREDGVAKTPEWAESICAVPAETIRAFAELYGRSAPVHLQFHYSGAKRHLGDYAAAASMILQSMTGNIVGPGGCESGSILGTPRHFPLPAADFQKAPMEYFPKPSFCTHKFAEAVLLREKFDRGDISEKDFRNAVGCRPDAPLPNIRIVVLENNQLNNHQQINKRLEAIRKVDFVFGFQWHLNHLSTQHMDIVLPAPLHMFETTDTFLNGQQRFVSGPCAMRNYFVYCRKMVPGPGEVRAKDWFWTQVAKRLGVGEKFNPRLVDVGPEQWDDEVEKIYKEGYETWAADAGGRLAAAGIKPLPWEEFLRQPVVRAPIDEPFYPFKNWLERGEKPWATPSGKIEFSSKYLEQTDLRDTEYGGQMDPMPVWQPSYMSEPAYDSPFSPRAAKYPLSLVTPVTPYRCLSCHDQNKTMRDEVYRHRVWINTADAKKRGISDNDQVLVYNEFGQIVMPAHVTSKTMPGAACIHFGAWYTPNAVTTETMPYGIDINGACNLLIGDNHLPHTVNALLTAGLVEIKRFGGAMK
ncbi:MAG: molybdopterin-dependent oxidoreductase [Gracilibacteraceae bacterium]|nr:molybdopterin-dependent oxidoreductase [Gracilibacteraceae bacterium]